MAPKEAQNGTALNEHDPPMRAVTAGWLLHFELRQLCEWQGTTLRAFRLQFAVPCLARHMHVLERHATFAEC